MKNIKILSLAVLSALTISNAVPVFAVDNTLVNSETITAANYTYMTGTVKTNGSPLTVRSNAGTYYSAIGSLPNNTKVEIVDSSYSGWYKIKYNYGYGYVSKSYVSLSETQAIIIGYVKTSGSSLTVRSNAGTSYSSLGYLANGSKIEIVDSSNSSWYKIKFNSSFGYVSRTYITLHNTQNVTGSMDVSDNLINFIKKYEGFTSTVYTDEAGNKTIGYGHLLKSGENYTSVTEAQATSILKSDLQVAISGVNNLCKNKNISLTQNEFDALVSFTFNLGVGTLNNSSLINYITSGGRNDDTLYNYFMQYVYASGSVSNGLKNRRYSEHQMFCYSTYSAISKF